MSSTEGVTKLLDRARGGDAVAFGELIGRIYNELRQIARGQRKRLGAAETINTTAVVHEAYAKMAGAAARRDGVQFVDRGHFFRVASRAMRDVIVDYARARSAEKRGGNERPLSLDGAVVVDSARGALDPSEVLSVHEALKRLEQFDAESARVAELRYFAGLTTDETAEALGLSVATVKRRWSVARAWLYQQLAS